MELPIKTKSKQKPLWIPAGEHQLLHTKHAQKELSAQSFVSVSSQPFWFLCPAQVLAFAVCGCLLSSLASLATLSGGQHSP